MPTTTYTYAELKTALQGWMEDDFEDFTDQLDDIIGKAELRCYRDLDLEVFDENDTSKSTAASTEVLAIADNALVLRSLYINDAFVEPRSESYVRYYQGLAAEGQPLYWCQTSETEILLAPVPDTTYATRQRVLKRPDGLSDSNPETFLSRHAGDLLFTAAKLESERFDKETGDMAAEEASYQERLPRVRDELRMLARTDYR